MKYLTTCACALRAHSTRTSHMSLAPEAGARVGLCLRAAHGGREGRHSVPLLASPQSSASPTYPGVVVCSFSTPPPSHVEARAGPGLDQPQLLLHRVLAELRSRVVCHAVEHGVVHPDEVLIDEVPWGLTGARRPVGRGPTRSRFSPRRAYAAGP